MIEELCCADSLIGRLDPRVKLVSAFAFAVVTAVCQGFSALTLALLVGITASAAARIPAGQQARSLLPVNLMVGFLWLFLPFTHAGDPMGRLGPLIFYREGVMLALRITLKSNAIILVLTTLVAGTPVFTLGHAMDALHLPQKLVHLFFFTYRYIHVIYREYARLLNAMKIRGFQPGTDLHTYRTYAYLVGMLLVKSSDRAERVRRAMICRGFHGRLYSLTTFSLQRRDLLSAAVMAAILLAMEVLEWAPMARSLI